MLPNNIAALIAAFGLAVLWLRLIDFFAHKGWISSWLSRKIIHIGTGPIFVVSWLLFPDQPAARYFAAVIPLAITAQFALVGLGILKDPAAVNAMSRTGDRREILRGPLIYGIAFVLLTVLYWKDSPIGIVALMMLCGGDGFAEVIGRIYGKRQLPWSKRKSWAGLIAMLAGGWTISLLVIWLYLSFGVFPGSISTYIPVLALISFAAMLVESLPIQDFDNITVPAVAALLGHLLFIN